MKKESNSERRPIRSDAYGRMSDAELYRLLCEAKPVSEAAFHEIYSRHSTRVYAYCRCVFGDDAEAMDIYQETFLRLYEGAEREKEMTNLPAYLLTIARHLCLNARRRKKDTVSFDEYDFPHMDASMERTDTLRIIMMAMELLPDEQREAFFLREFEDLSYGDIATLLGTTEIAARVRVSRARRKIRGILKPYFSEMTS